MSDDQGRGGWDEPTHAMPRIPQQGNPQQPNQGAPQGNQPQQGQYGNQYGQQPQQYGQQPPQQYGGQQPPPPNRAPYGAGQPPYGAPQQRQPPQGYGQGPGQGYGPGYAQGQQQPQQYSGQQQYGAAPGQWGGQPGFGQQAYAGAPGASTGRPGGLGKTLGWVLVALGLLAIVGCFGPWAKVDANIPMFGNIHITANGLGGTSDNMPSSSSSGSSDTSNDIKDGWVVLVAALGVIVVGLLRGLGKLPKPAAWGAAVLGLVIAGIGIYDWSDVSDKAQTAKDQMEAAASGVSVSAGAGWGLYLVLLMGIGIVVAGVLSALRD